jgi:hypothetical protein
MDGRRFDQLTRAFGKSPTRRHFLRALAVSIAGAVLAVTEVDASDAKQSSKPQESPKPRKPRKPRKPKKPEKLEVCRNNADCGECGLCDRSSGLCYVDPVGCGSSACHTCDPATLTCIPLPDASFCEGCGSCLAGVCTPDSGACNECQKCSGDLTCVPDRDLDLDECGSTGCHLCMAGECRQVAMGRVAGIRMARAATASVTTRTVAASATHASDVTAAIVNRSNASPA